MSAGGPRRIVCADSRAAASTRATGVRDTSVIRNGQMLGVSPKGSAARFASSGLVGGAHGGRGGVEGLRLLVIGCEDLRYLGSGR
jgi:hypothetical protein